MDSTHTREVAVRQRRLEASKKGEATRLRKQLEQAQLRAARDKDWTTVTVISGTIFQLALRGEI